MGIRVPPLPHPSRSHGRARIGRVSFGSVGARRARARRCRCCGLWRAKRTSCRPTGPARPSADLCPRALSPGPASQGPGPIAGCPGDLATGGRGGPRGDAGRATAEQRGSPPAPLPPPRGVGGWSGRDAAIAESTFNQTTVRPGGQRCEWVSLGDSPGAGRASSFQKLPRRTCPGRLHVSRPHTPHPPHQPVASSSRRPLSSRPHSGPQPPSPQDPDGALPAPVRP